MSVSGLPTELLHSIIAWITVEYIDDLIVGSLKLPTLPILDQVNPLRELKDEEDPSHKAPNPIAPLLSVSCQFRATTLHILSRALDIPLSPISPNVDRRVIFICCCPMSELDLIDWLSSPGPVFNRFV